MIKVFTFFLVVLVNVVYAQTPTVGLISYDSRVQEGYTLLSTQHSTTTYLMDNCGFVVHTWESDYYPGVTAELLPNGDLLRATRVNDDTFIHGGAGGRVEILNWDGSIKWEFTYSTAEFRQHHEVIALENGNVLFLAWDKRTKLEAIDAGRNPALIGIDSDDTWGEHLVEVKPLDNNGFEIVWEWYSWDHLIQEYDNTKSNFGVVSESPERINLNFISNEIDGSDLIHANGFSLNETLDQIILSSRNYNEFWVIDHSTTTLEAKGSTGGNYGMGGDIIYRYGNPQAYNMGTASDKVLFGQHNVHWTGSGYSILLFNNGYKREGAEYSSVEFLTLPTNNELYYLEADGTYGPTSVDRSYASTDIEGFEYSGFVSGVEELENENILICSGAVGNLVEITKEGEPVWNYINPITATGIVDQGFSIKDEPGLRNLVFRAYKYPSSFLGLVGKQLDPTIRIEGSPYETFPCDAILSVVNLKEPGYQVYPNPAIGLINLPIDKEKYINLRVYISDVLGNKREIKGFDIEGDILSVNLDDLANGVHIIYLMSDLHQESYKFVVGK